MSDPTVFENLKVAFENHIYDLDNLEQAIHILHRKDQLDLAVMAREFTIRFTRVGFPSVIVDLKLHSSLKELADEILEIKDMDPGCTLTLLVRTFVQDVDTECEEIATILRTVWENDISYTQTLSFRHEQTEPGFMNRINIQFKPKLTEEHMGEISAFLKSVLDMMEQIGELS
ncbi:hypothetical protein CSV80_17050 [Sporosarcina sp. P12(2017)]|uniref:hypothetical protein n=1 Tax=unclassified Sporosarcina TaxID=2647733 RepID=UPI000C163269|nr:MULTISPECIES: hypothetical protein [unclassified Sporosarcina]PIC55954.1 hypothetical protein CSV81_17015 [Sporosarcina sp. P10]PIC59274.1 hypothetical protein CSV80_17050 [Sporosarcina sp. P12(2017)]